MTIRMMRHQFLGKRFFLYWGWVGLSTTISEHSYRVSWSSWVQKMFIPKGVKEAQFQVGRRHIYPINRKDTTQRKQDQIPYYKSHALTFLLQVKLYRWRTRRLSIALCLDSQETQETLRLPSVKRSTYLTGKESTTKTIWWAASPASQRTHTSRRQ